MQRAATMVVAIDATINQVIVVNRLKVAAKSFPANNPTPTFNGMIMPSAAIIIIGGSHPIPWERRDAVWRHCQGAIGVSTNRTTSITTRICKSRFWLTQNQISVLIFSAIPTSASEAMYGTAGN